MARGWDSKAVEAQIATAENGNQKQTNGPLTPAQRERLQRRQGLLLSRTRVLNDLETARNERYRAILQQALAQLDRDLAALQEQS